MCNNLMLHELMSGSGKGQTEVYSKESTYFTDTTAKWLDEADVKVVKKVIKTLKITDKHTFMAPTPTPVPETPTPERM